MMGVIIIGICVLVTYILFSVCKYYFMYGIIDAEYKKFKELTFNYPTERLHCLYTNLEQAENRLKKMIDADINVLSTQTESDNVSFWRDEINKDRQLLSRFQNMMKEIKQELDRREFFHSSW